MKSLFFIFSISALPIAVFSEARHSQAAVPNMKKSTFLDPQDYRCQDGTINCASTPSFQQQQQRKPQEQQREQDLKRLEKIKENQEMHLIRGTRIATKKHSPPATKNH